MTLRPRSLRLPSLLALAVALAAPAASAGVIVNIDGARFGYAESPHIPDVGEAVTPIDAAPGGPTSRILFTAGTYRVTNAFGQLGALYQAFRFNQATDGAPWSWSFLITNDTDGDKAVLYGEAGDLGATADAVGDQDVVRDFEAFFTLTSNAWLNFMVRDYYVGDNAGGVSLLIQEVAPLDPAAVPEPASMIMMGVAGSALAAAAFARRRKA